MCYLIMRLLRKSVIFFACDLNAYLVTMLPTILVTYCVHMCHRWTLGTVSITHVVITVHMSQVYVEVLLNIFLKTLLSCVSYLIFQTGIWIRNFWNIILSNVTQNHDQYIPVIVRFILVHPLQQQMETFEQNG